MSIKDLFKKSTQQEPAKPNQADSTLFDPELQKKRYEAAMEFIKEFQNRMPLVGGKPHAGTVLAVAARLAGTSLFRSLNYKKEFAPGVVVLSDEVNKAWPPLMNLFASYCKQNGIDVTSKPMVTKFPESDKPCMTVEQVLQEYQDQYHEIMKKHGLDYLEGARAAMIVTSIVFKYHYIQRKDIDPYVAAGIVAMGIVEGAKTAPPPLGSKPVATVKKMAHLLLGEPDVVREEARRVTGAIYIEPNPQVLQTLKQGNVDPYRVYESGVRQQIEEKIACIDFVKVDVEQVFKEWQNRPLTDAPIHVRLVFWLKEHAGAHGYEQSGNSWLLK